MARLLSTLLIAGVSIVVLAATGRSQAQQPNKGGGDPTVSLRFRNDTKGPILVQGISRIKNVERRGQPILIQPGKAAFENNVPAGTRLLTIVDYNRPSRVLFKDVLQLPPGRDIPLVLRTVPNTDRVILTPDQ